MSTRDFRHHVLHHYSHFAEYYDFAEFIRLDTRHKAVALSGVKPGESVLDVCTGTGELAMAFARRGAHIIGVDISLAMLARAASKQVHPKPTFLEMDAVALKFHDQSFDICTISLALHHMPEDVQHRVLTEMARVSRRKVVIVEPHTPQNPRLWKAWATVASWIDESELLHDWARQDFDETCWTAGLEVERNQVATLGIHRITVCRTRKRHNHDL